MAGSTRWESRRVRGYAGTQVRGYAGTAGTAGTMPKSKKIDLYNEHADEYLAPKTPVLLTIGPAKYLAIDGKGAPGRAAFVSAVGALYNVAFTIKMARKFGGKQD